MPVCDPRRDPACRGLFPGSFAACETESALIVPEVLIVRVFRQFETITGECAQQIAQQLRLLILEVVGMSIVHTHFRSLLEVFPSLKLIETSSGRDVGLMRLGRVGR